MTIGELLKEKRLAENKTQKAWVGHIISTSYYAKVEKNIHRITAEDLLAILKHNDLSITDFFEELADKKDELKAQVNSLNKTVIDAVYHSDVSKVNEVIQIIKKMDLPTKQKQELILINKGFIETIKNDLSDNYQPDKNIVQQLKDKIFSIPNFNRFKLELYTNFMQFYDYTTNIMITKQVIHKIDQFKSDKELLAIAGILFNLLSQLVEEHHYQETAPFIAASEHLPFLPDLYFPQTGISLLKYLISYHFNKKPADLAKAEMIAQTYQITGLENFGKGAQEIINEVKED